jgi:hypothetical protein
LSALTIAQAVARDSGFSVPATLVGNSDDTASMLLALLNKSGKALAGYSWQVLQKEGTVTTVASTPSYALPADYGWIENNTLWDRTNLWKDRGSLTPSEWQAYKSGIASTTPRSRFRVKLGRLYIDPTPSSVVTLAYEYVSNQWCWDGVSAYANNFVTDNYVSLIDEYLLELDVTWRFLARKGMAYAEEKAEADDQIWTALGQDVPKGPVNLGDDNVPWPPLPTWPYTGLS